MRALCDINPAHLAKADEILAEAKQPKARHYDDWKEMLQKEDLEAVILAPPLWLHAEMTVGCLEAGKHVLCEKMMAWDEEGCRRMQEAARKTGRLLEIGYQRFYNPVYQAAHEGIIKAGLLGDVYHARLVWHRNGDLAAPGRPARPGYDPSRWGYPTFDHLLNWRLFWRYSKGLLAELASHQVNIVELVLRRRARGGLGLGRGLPFPGGRARGRGPRVRDLRVPAGPHRGLLLDRVERLRRLLRDVHGHEGHPRPEPRDRGLSLPGGRRARPPPSKWRPRARGRPSRPPRPHDLQTGGSWTAATAAVTAVPQLSLRDLRVLRGRPGGRARSRCGPDKAVGSARACLAAHEAIQKKTRVVLA